MISEYINPGALCRTVSEAEVKTVPLMVMFDLPI